VTRRVPEPDRWDSEPDRSLSECDRWGPEGRRGCSRGEGMAFRMRSPEPCRLAAGARNAIDRVPDAIDGSWKAIDRFRRPGCDIPEVAGGAHRVARGARNASCLTVGAIQAARNVIRRAWMPARAPIPWEQRESRRAVNGASSRLASLPPQHPETSGRAAAVTSLRVSSCGVRDEGVAEHPWPTSGAPRRAGAAPATTGRRRRR